MDANKLRAEVFEKTGIKVDTADPVFALVALNEAVLADYARQQAAELQGATDQLKEQSRLLQETAERTRHLLLQMGKTVEEPPGATSRLPAKPFPLPLPLLALAGATAVLTAALVGVVQGMSGAPRPSIPASVVAPAQAQPATSAPALTAEQQQHLQDGEKLAKAWPKLDARTQAKIQAAMQ